VFRFDGTEWGEEEQLFPSDLSFFKHFGWSVGAFGDIVVIGAPDDATAADGAGAVYVFRFDGSIWVEEAKLTHLDLVAGDQLGWSIGVDADRLVAGAPGHDDYGDRSGAAYVFHYDGSGWVEEAKLVPPTGAPDEYFGYSVSISGDTIVVGAHFDGSNGAQAGSAHVFRFDGVDWLHQAELTASDGATGDNFGRSVAVTGSAIVAGAPHDDDYGIDSGSVYVFDTCPMGTVAAVPEQSTVTNPLTDWSWPIGPPAPTTRTYVAGGVPGMATAAMALVREDTYAYFLEESLHTHYGDSRGTYGPELLLARQNIATTLASLGLTVTLEPFTFGGETHYNVVGTLWGSTLPDEEYIIGSHYDSVGNGGSDDNASGSALVLEAARVLSRYESQRTIRFVTFDQEEVGTIGSEAYVTDHAGDNILGMISADMVAHYGGTETLHIGCGPVSTLLEASLAQAVAAYGDGLTGILTGQSWSSDHAPFEAAGIPGCYYAESDLDPVFHTVLDTTDLPGHLDYSYAARLVRIIVGFLVDNAGIDTCIPPDPVTTAPNARSLNRFLSFTPTNAGQRTAIRVKLVSLNHPDPPPTGGTSADFSSYEGEVRWVGPPVELPEFSEVGPPFAEPTWMGAALQCEPYYADWGSGLLLNVYGAEILPDSTYDVQAILEVCADRLDDETRYSSPVPIATARWGDIAPLYAGGNNPPQPDFVDISSEVTKFVGGLDPTKVQALLRFNVPPVNDSIDFRDIANCVSGFVGDPYPYDGPCTCPSSATCPTLDACGRCTP